MDAGKNSNEAPRSTKHRRAEDKTAEGTSDIQVLRRSPRKKRLRQTTMEDHLVQSSTSKGAAAGDKKAATSKSSAADEGPKICGGNGADKKMGARKLFYPPVVEMTPNADIGNTRLEPQRPQQMSLDQLEKREAMAAAALKRVTVTDSRQAKGTTEAIDSAPKPSSLLAFFEAEETSQDLPSASRVDSLKRPPIRSVSSSSTASCSKTDSELRSERLKQASPIGVRLEDLRRSTFDGPPLAVSANHAVIFKVGGWTSEGGAAGRPEPWPRAFVDVWDGEHVRMPSSPQNVYPSADGSLVNRWELIENALVGAQTWTSSDDIQSAILAYNRRYEGKWSFAGLHQFFNEYLTAADAQLILGQTVPEMAQLVLRQRQIVTAPLPLLKQGSNKALSLSQEQTACLLANAFFCTFPRRNALSRKMGRNAEFATFPHIHFYGLFAETSRVNMEKLRCIMHYFQRVTENMPSGFLTFERRTLAPTEYPRWETSTVPITPNCYVSAEGKIEDEGEGMLQMDFANCYLGGGVLRHGCVQEEIRFLICPELLLSLLFTEVLAANECLFMRGCERFSNYTGYADTFRWAGPHVDRTPMERNGGRRVEIVALDAQPFRSRVAKLDQFLDDAVLRELNKAFVGFCGGNGGRTAADLPAVATGNWGCGAFGGDPELKSLLQLLAASEACRGLAYFTFGERPMAAALRHMHALLLRRRLSVGDVYGLLMEYGQAFVEPVLSASRQPAAPAISLFDFLHGQIGTP